ncbi:DJ-1 family glyoxalase III [Carboxylicivirga sp. M1479]|uniref:DJ-1 family glyoxalase III n=1 Tax=Carboxylicivirga sp. M1479 TaxID=2594476 RepID=UPI0011788995|nr:DJ-1 family glyoxalase III [Carboxylicivirga sp. M1479]TRX62015.1 DJ-1/PfpI family protein [Carboxylicivirga sp. M1479]
MKKVVVFLADGFEEVEAITPIDVLRRVDIKVTSVSISNTKEVTGSHNITIIADQLLKDTDFSAFDAAILPGGMPGTLNLNDNDQLKKIILDFDKDNKVIGAICAAPLILGELGLLKNKKAVCYPGFEKHLTGASIEKTPVAKDHNYITGNGIGAAMLFSLNLVNELCGTETADELARTMMVHK